MLLNYLNRKTSPDSFSCAIDQTSPLFQEMNKESEGALEGELGVISSKAMSL